MLTNREVKVIGVVASSFKTGMEFAKDHLIKKGQKLDHINVNYGMIYTKDGFAYKIIIQEEDGLAYQFVDILKSPCYKDLYALMVKRIR